RPPPATFAPGGMVPDQRAAARVEIVGLLAGVRNVDALRRNGRRAVVAVLHRSGPKDVAGGLRDRVERPTRARAAHVHDAARRRGGGREGVLTGKLHAPEQLPGSGIEGSEEAIEVDDEHPAGVVGRLRPAVGSTHGSWSPEGAARGWAERHEG